MILRQNERAVFYTRDSSGRHEMTPGEYVKWGQQTAENLGLKFDGTAEIIEQMIRNDEYRRGDIFLDYGISGNRFDRPGLSALMEVIASDRSIKCVMIPRQDRLARPDNPEDGLNLENAVRRMGCKLVYIDRVLQPIKTGSRQDIGELITSLIAFNHAGEDRRQLAQKVILAKIALAKAGFSTGGRAPYAFRRWLVRTDGTLVRELADGEKVRMAGHHVIHWPVADDHPEMIVVRRILEMLEQMPAARVAASLTAEGIPTPDHGRTRTDRGVVHITSGDWHSTSIINIARNSLLVAMSSFGRRSEGDQLRFTSTGPRELTEDDLREDKRPKVIRNPEDQVIQTPAFFPPLVDVDRQKRLLGMLDERAGSQKGKPRARDPKMNPLGGRVFDLNCSWLMYRAPDQKSFRYTCGAYQQSHGEQCAHNHVDGPAAVRFVLSCLRQRGLMSPTFLPKLRQRLEELVHVGQSKSKRNVNQNLKKRKLQSIQSQLETVGRNMALAQNETQYNRISREFDQLTAKEAELRNELADGGAEPIVTSWENDAVEAAVVAFNQLPSLAGDSANFEKLGKLFTLLNVKLFVGFRPERLKKREVNRLTHGTVTFGAAEPPIKIYDGPTARKRLKCDQAALSAVSPGEKAVKMARPGSYGSGMEGKSLGNVNRGDRTPIELFLAGVASWEPYVERLLVAA